MNLVKQVLVDLRDLYSNESKWTQKEGARTKSGLGCVYDYPGAVCWCVTGGLNKVIGEMWNKEFDGMSFDEKQQIRVNARAILSGIAIGRDKKAREVSETQVGGDIAAIQVYNDAPFVYFRDIQSWMQEAVEHATVLYPDTIVLEVRDDV